MAAMKLAIFFFTLSPLPGAYHARHLHDGYIYQRFDRRPPVKTAEVIQMVTGKDEPQSPHVPPPPPPSSQEDTNNGLDDPNAPPSQVVAPSQGKTNYGGENPKAPLPPKVAPSQGQTVYGGEKLKGSPSPEGPSPEGQTNYGRDNPNAPPPPKVAPSRGQTTYGGENPNANSWTIYGWDNPKAPQVTIGRDDPTTPPCKSRPKARRLSGNVWSS